MDISSLMGYLPGSTSGYVNLISVIIAASAIGAASIAKYTKNKTDDKIASWLAKAHDLLGFVGLQPSLEQKRAPLPRDPQSIRDHRNGV